MDVPPPIPPRPPGWVVRPPANPPLPPRRDAEQQPQMAQSLPPPPQTYRPQQHHATVGENEPSQAPQGLPTHWSALYYPDGAPTLLFKELMVATFKCLDPQGTGYIQPEVLSNFLDLNEFLPEENLWKSQLKGNLMFAPEDIADAELKWAYAAWPFDHKVVVRSPGRAQLPYGGMPLLSLRGLTDMMAVENAAEPDRGHRGINAVLARYRIWPHLGPLPRECLLPERPPQIQRRIDQARERATRASQEILESTRAQSRIMAEGRQFAIDLVSPSYVKRYYY